MGFGGRVGGGSGEGGGGGGKIATHSYRCFSWMAFHFSSFSTFCSVNSYGFLQEISFWKLTVQTWRNRIINQ